MIEKNDPYKQVVCKKYTQTY